MASAGLKTPALLHVSKWRSNLIQSLTAFANVSMVTHSLVVLGYVIIALANLPVSPGGIQDITLPCLITSHSLVDLLTVRVGNIQ